jgi:hypothetical protein
MLILVMERLVNGHTGEQVLISYKGGIRRVRIIEEFQDPSESEFRVGTEDES